MGGQRKPMISYAQNGEDVLLERLFGGQADGFYVDVGANDPTDLSLTRHFYDRGWRGINIEPVPDAYGRLCAERPRDTNLNVGVAARAGEMTFYELPDQSTLSTFSAEQAALYRAEGRQVVERPVRVLPLAEVFAAHVDRPVDFLSVDVEGLEREVLAGGDWKRWRPRVVLLEATRPNTTEPTHQDWEPLLLEAGYRFAYFDGLNRFYVRAEEPALLEGFRVPVNVCDNYVHYHYTRQVEALRERAADAERHMQQMFAELTGTHAALAEARGVVDSLVEQVKQHRGWLDGAQAELGATRAELGAAKAELVAANARATDLQGQLADAVGRFTQASEAVRRLTEQVRGQQARLAQTEQALAAERALMDPFRRMGPMTVRLAHLLQGSSHRFPRLARGVKSVLRGTARLKRLVRPRAA
jgi:FkbM family methyltransferase